MYIFNGFIGHLLTEVYGRNVICWRVKDWCKLNYRNCHCDPSADGGNRKSILHCSRLPHRCALRNDKVVF
jgi:hypothetical protein